MNHQAEHLERLLQEERAKVAALEAEKAARQQAVPGSEDLLPCPHCGGDVDFHKDEECSGCHYIWCGQCNAFFDFATGVRRNVEQARRRPCPC